jgi:putative transposase
MLAPPPPRARRKPSRSPGKRARAGTDLQRLLPRAEGAPRRRTRQPHEYPVHLARPDTRPGDNPPPRDHNEDQISDERNELDGAVRGRPGRRSVGDRTDAVLALLAGKASVDRLALRYGVRKETIEGWRAEALAGEDAGLRHGGTSPRERELEKELDVAKAALTRAILQKELLEPAHFAGAALRGGGALEVANVSRQTSVGEAPLTLACETFRVARSSVYGALQAASASKHRATPPDAVPPPELAAAVRAVLDQQPGWGHRKVWATLRRRGPDRAPLRVGRRRVYELMRAHGWTLPSNHREPEPRRGHVTVAEPNRRIAADLTTVPTRKGGLIAVVITVDRGCRSVLNATATFPQTCTAVLGAVEMGLIEAFGHPEAVGDGVELRTDHGPQFTGSDAGALCARWRIARTFSPVGRPTGTSVAERTIQTAKVDRLWLRDFDDAANVQRALDAWRQAFTHERPIQALGWRTPADRRVERLAPPPERIAASPQEPPRRRRTRSRCPPAARRPLAAGPAGARRAVAPTLG